MQNQSKSDMGGFGGITPTIAVPTTSTFPGQPGQEIYDIPNNRVYKCIAPNFWCYLSITSLQAVTPLSIANCRLWLDASQLSYSDGNSVASWPDLSGSGHDASASGLGQPTFKTNIQGGLPVVRFDGSANTMTGSQLVSTVPIHVFAIANIVAMAGGVGKNLGMLIEQQSGGTESWGLYRDQSGPMRTFQSANLDSPTLSIGAFHFLEGLVNGVSSLSGVDGVTNAGTVGSTTVQYGYQLAQQGPASQFHQWDIAELIVYEAQLSTTDRVRIKNYLSAKWGVTVS